MLQGHTLCVSGNEDKDTWCFSETKHYVKVYGKKEAVKIEYGETWELDLETLAWTHVESEWKTVPKKGRKGRGRRRN